VVSASNSC